MKKILNTIYPPQCLACQALVVENHSLCGSCLSQLTFARGLSCKQCAQPLPGLSTQNELCDDCMSAPPPWLRAEVVFLYEGAARNLILNFKNQDRTDLAQPLGGWLSDKVADFFLKDALIAPVPLHWTRMIARKYNQSALLARVVAQKTGHEFVPGLLKRVKRTRKLSNFDADRRAAILSKAIEVRSKKQVYGRDIVLIDDVFTTGTTLRHCAQMCHDAGANSVFVAALARARTDK